MKEKGAIILGVAEFESKEFLTSLLRFFPGDIGVRLRRIYYSKLLGKCGNHLSIREGVYFQHPGKIMMGNRIGINMYSMLEGFFGIEIGDDVIIGPYTMIESANHLYSDLHAPISEQGYTGAKIIIEDGVWVGAGVVILPGIRLGEGCIVGAGAVVNKDVEPFEIVGGVPSKQIGRRR